MTLRHLKIFTEVARTGKMSTAAQNCYISQPTVSQAIRELESYYNVRLFERLSKKLFITPEGKVLLTYAQRTLEQYHQLEEAMNGIDTHSSLRIGATITIGACMLPDIITDLNTLDESLLHYTYVGNTKSIEDKLLKSELDIGLVEGIIDSPDLITIPIVEDFLVLAMSPDHHLAQKENLALSDLQNERFVLRESGSGTRRLFSDYMARHNISFNVMCESGCPESIKRIASRNNCLAVLSIRLLEEEIKNKSMRVFINHDHEWNRSFYLVYHKDKYISESMKTFKTLLEKYKAPYIPSDYDFGSILK